MALIQKNDVLVRVSEVSAGAWKCQVIQPAENAVFCFDRLSLGGTHVSRDNFKPGGGWIEVYGDLEIERGEVRIHFKPAPS